MGLTELDEDKYSNDCNYLILQANFLYTNIKDSKNKHLLHKDDWNYIEDANKYINNWKFYRKLLIKTFKIYLIIYKKILNNY